MVHWRDIYGISKPPADQVRVRLEKEMSRFCNQPHPPEMPPTTEQRVREEVKTEFSIGEQVIFQASQDGRVEYGEIIASKPLVLYLVQVDGQKSPEKIEPEDVMNRDCCNLGPPEKGSEVHFYNCQKDIECVGIMMDTRQKQVYCIVNEHEKQYHIGPVYKLV